MGKRILITGGAGFIGSHLADELLQQGHQVRALDNLSAQVHGPDAKRPAYLDRDVELVTGDITDASIVRKCVRGIDVAYHLAAAVGVGQSMYEIAQYTAVNNLGTAVLLEALCNKPVERLIVASSMSVYGEGLYRLPSDGLMPTVGRTAEQLKAHEWEPRSAQGDVLEPVPTPEWKPPSLASIYALSKYDQERMCLITGGAYGIPTTALRLFNVYGTRQSLNNPYTGVLAIFASRLLNHAAPLVYEDGLQRRDFVHVRDVAQALRRAMERRESAGAVINVGSGESRTIGEIAVQLANTLGKPHICPEITGKYRVGDIRHCFADITAARNLLGYEPRVGFGQGLAEVAEWLHGQIAQDHALEASAELDSRGLSI